MMSALKLSCIAEQMAGQIKEDASFNSVCTDTRHLQQGDLFVALRGENFDGNRFVAKAANGGAVAAIVDGACDVAIPQLVVADTREALGVVARCNRRLFAGPVIALTGSAGKTTCKEMIAAILTECGDVLATVGNLNNEVGVPLTLLQINSEHDYAVIEMGASRAGDIEYLCRFAEPDIALLTNAMPAHIEGFGDLDTVASTKGEIFESLDDDGIAIINYDDRFFGQWRVQAGERKTVSFSRSDAAADVYARDIQMQGDGVSRFTLCSWQGSVEISLSLLGKHNITNALAAAAATLAAGASLLAVQAGLGAVTAVKGRMQVHHLPNLTVIDDSYNANPVAVNAAIDALVGFPGKRCLMLGKMAELGSESASLHDDVAAYAKKKGVDQLIVTGDYAPAQAAVFGAGAHAFGSVEGLLKNLKKFTDADVVLVKGSRSAQMERVVDALIDGSLTDTANGRNQ